MPLSTYTWIGNAGSALSTNDPSNWSPAGPPGGDSDVIVNAGTLLLPVDPELTGNTVYVQSATLVLYGDTLTTLNVPTFDNATYLTTNVAPIETAITTALTTALDAYGIFINEGSIQADGPAGSQFAIAVAGTTINSVFVPGTLINTGEIEVDAGNAMTIAVSGTSDLFAIGTVLVDGGTLSYSAASVATLPGLPAGTALTLIEADGTLIQTANATIGAAAGDPGSATVETGGLWNIGFTGAPGLTVGLAAAGSLAVTGGTVELGSSGLAIGSGAAGTVTVSGAGSRLVDAGGMSVGKSSAGTLNVLNGGTIEMSGTQGITVGNAAGSTGNLYVAGTAAGGGLGALVQFDTGSKGFTVGNAGSGALTVGAGGTILMNGTGGVAVGATLGVTGSVTVSGAGAVLSMGTTGNGFSIGQSGTGFLTIQNGGSVTIASTGGIGIATSSKTGSGSVLVGGGGGNAFLTASAGAASIASAGTGDLDIESGGSVVLDGVFIASGSTGVGTVMVNGGFLSDSNPFTVGGAGIGTLEIGAGGFVTQTATSGVNAGLNTGSQGFILVHGGTLADTAAGSSFVTIGQSGTGSLDIQGASGTIGLVNLGTNTLALGNGSGSAGALSIEANGTLLAGGLNVADTFSGTAAAIATIGTGGVVTVGQVNEGAGGTIDVTGGTLTSTGALTIAGQSGTAPPSLTLNSGTVTTDGLQIATVAGQTATVLVAGGTLISTGTTGGFGLGPGLYIGSSGTGDLAIQAGASVSTQGGVFIGNGPTTSSGDLSVQGILTDAGGFTVGGQGSGTLTIGQGGLVTQTGTGFEIGSFVGAQGTVLVSGGTLFAPGTTTGTIISQMDVGANGYGSIDIAGTLGASGIVDAGTDTVSIATQSGSSGRLSVDSGGTLIAGALWIADTFTGTSAGTVSIGSGGIVQVGSVQQGAGGVIDVTGGTLTTTGMIGLNGQAGTVAALTLNGGSIATDGLSIGSGTVTTTVDVAGGVLTTTGLLVVGAVNNGLLQVDTGGIVNAQDGLTVDPPLVAGNGTVVVDGGTLDVSGGFTSIGNNGTAIVTVEAGGLFAITGTNALSIGSDTAGTASVVVSGGTFTTSGAPFFVGGSGSLLVENAGTVVTTTSGFGPSVDINTTGGNEAAVTVTGTASVWQVVNPTQGAQFIVGDTGQGMLSVANGGLVNAGTLAVDIGNQAGGTGMLAVGGGGATFEGGALVVGNTTSGNGNGVLDVATGGIVDATGLTVGALGTVDLTGGTIASPGTFSANNGLIEGYGVLNTSLFDNTAMLATGGTLEVTGILLGGGSITIAGSAALQMDGLLGNGLTVTFATGAPEILDLGAPNVGNNGFALDNWQNGDEIAFSNGATITGAQWLGSGTLAVASSIGTFDFTDVSLGALTFPIFTTGTNFVELISCFAAGTRIRTPQGDVAVETLAEGDLVNTALHGKPAPVVWIGHRRVNCAAHPAPRRVWPVRVSSGAFGPRLPERDLMLSPDHAVYVNDVLIPVRRLVNGTSIVQVPMAQVTYYHVELPAHDVIFAEGLPTESYLDVGQRDNFANNAGPVRLHADFADVWEAEGCAPLMVIGPPVEAARAMIASRAAAAERAAG